MWRALDPVLLSREPLADMPVFHLIPVVLGLWTSAATSGFPLRNVSTRRVHLWPAEPAERPTFCPCSECMSCLVAVCGVTALALC